MHSFVMTNEFVGEGEAGHQTALLQPEDRSKGTREEDILHSGEGDEVFRKHRMLVRDPTEGPVGLALNARNCFDGVEEVIMLDGVLDVSIDEESVGFRVDVLHHDLETSLSLHPRTLYTFFVYITFARHLVHHIKARVYGR